MKNTYTMISVWAGVLLTLSLGATELKSVVRNLRQCASRRIAEKALEPKASDIWMPKCLK